MSNEKLCYSFLIRVYSGCAVLESPSKKLISTKAWDRYQIPKPFARVGYYIGEPFVIDKDMDLSKANIELGYLLHRAEYKAA